MFKEFNLESLKELDFGRISAAFDTERERVVKDCQDRPGDGKPRSIAIKFNFYPQSDGSESVDCDEVKVECEITSTVPKRRTKIYTMKPVRDGKLRFNADDPDDPENPTLLDQTGAERTAN